MVKVAIVEITLNSISLESDWDSAYIDACLKVETQGIKWVSVTEEEYELLKNQYSNYVNYKYSGQILLAVSEEKDSQPIVPSIQSLLEEAKKELAKKEAEEKKRAVAAAKKKAAAEKKKKEKELKLLEELKNKYE